MKKTTFIKKYAWRFQQRQQYCVSTGFVVGSPCSTVFCTRPYDCNAEGIKEVYKQIVNYFDMQIELGHNPHVQNCLKDIKWSAESSNIDEKIWLKVVKLTEDKALEMAIPTVLNNTYF